MNQKQCTKCGLEFLGTVFFLYVVLLTSDAWAIGLALAFAIYVAGGGHFNPAISIMMYAKNKLSLEETMMYIVAQVLGGLVALGLYKLI
jgi:aquaporin Z